MFNLEFHNIVHLRLSQCPHFTQVFDNLNNIEIRLNFRFCDIAKLDELNIFFRELIVVLIPKTHLKVTFDKQLNHISCGKFNSIMSLDLLEFVFCDYPFL